MPTLLASLGSWFGGTVNMVITPFYVLFALHATYCFITRTNVNNHKRATGSLANNKQQVLERIKQDSLKGLTTTESTLVWLKNVNKAISEEAKNHLRYKQRLIIFGCCPLNGWENYKISKRAVEKLKDVECLLSKAPPFNTVSEAPPAPPVVNLHPQSPHLTLGRQAIVAEALQFIEKDGTVGIIGMCGPDKDEKTELLMKINNSFIGTNFFDFVIFVTASTECSVQHIQALIISRLGIQKHDDVVTPDTMISELLWRKNILVLVDDLHGELDLRAVGIPYPLGVVQVHAVGGRLKRKVVITSPSTSIHNLMNVDKQIEVPSVEEDQARQLFNQHFGVQEDLYSDPHIGALAKDLVREIKGLPLELEHFGKLMKGHRDARRWEVTIEAVRKANLRKDDSSFVVDKIVRNLEDCKEDLIAKRKDVYQNIENAEREGKTRTNEVKRWLEKVDVVICDAEAISANHQLKKDVTMAAAEKLLAVKECLGSLPSDIAVESAPRPVIEMPGAYMSAEKNHNLEVALNFIKDYPTGIIGIWGPGGVGKTYILIRINNSPDEDLPFNIVVYVTASRGCSVKKIQADIVCRLKLRKDDNQESQRCIISDFLKMRSFLILLDDLWDRIDLEAVGIPYPLGTVNQLRRKVVLTTRSRYVCGQMEVRKELKVAYMQEDEAWQLFQEKVGRGTLSSSPRIEELAKRLVKELKGLPSALLTTGRAMYAKTCTHQWEYAIEYMQKSCYGKDDPLDMEKTVFSQLKFSYDSLRDDTLRDCFCTFALLPEDHEIPKEKLAQFWIVLGLVKVDEDIQSSYKKAYSLMGDLAAACLIDVCGKLCNSFKMHDVVRGMAHWINNDRWVVRAGVGMDKTFSPSNKAECISLMWNQMKKLPPFCSSTCPMKLQMLCLGHNALDGSIIAQEIKKFTSLTYLDLCFNVLREIPEELCSLVNLEHLDLSYNYYIQEVPNSFRNLIKLKFLHLQKTRIQSIPAGVISSLIALQVIDLRIVSSESSGDFISSRLFEDLLILPSLKAVDIKVRNFAQYESLRREGANLPIRHLIVEIESCAPLYIFDIASHDFARRTLYELAIEDCNMEQIIVRRELARLYCFATLNKLSLIHLYYLREIMFMGTSPASLFPWLVWKWKHATN